MGSWSFLTNHALVLLHISRWPESTGLEIAQTIGITERATRKIVSDLHVAGYIERQRVGRRNRYRVDRRRPVLRIGGSELIVGELLDLILRDDESEPRESSSSVVRRIAAPPL